ncbi:MAG: RNA polymerase sigma factor [Elusimicrobia bacterium]|nr:RNA polymerase sigma factor [Elusimicrobiota bacterium]
MTLDARLVRKAVAGDRDAFGKLVRNYQKPLHALIWRLIGDAANAEEIAQDVFVTAYQKLEQLKDASRFGGWLRSIALSRCRMWWRLRKRESRTVPIPLEDIAEADGSRSEAPAHEFERPLAVEPMIGRLPARLRTAALLCFMEGVSPAAAASILGLKPGTFRKRLHEARARLQREIVGTAERGFRMHLLPRDFAERCVCRCEKSRRHAALLEVRPMNKKVACGCGCAGAAKVRGKKRRRSKAKK